MDGVHNSVSLSPHMHRQCDSVITEHYQYFSAWQATAGRARRSLLFSATPAHGLCNLCTLHCPTFPNGTSNPRRIL